MPEILRIGKNLSADRDFSLIENRKDFEMPAFRKRKAKVLVYLRQQRRLSRKNAYF
ncbi:hypothetical protein G159_10005 [Planococcus glaciei CHR43]|nr:hypothetical protein G159_10005 [Planococcus glaciei CHR43]